MVHDLVRVLRDIIELDAEHFEGSRHGQTMGAGENQCDR